MAGEKEYTPTVMSAENWILSDSGAEFENHPDLKKGENELLFLVSGKTGDWEIQARFDNSEGLKPE